MTHNIMAGETLVPYNLKTLQPKMERLGYYFQYTPETPTTMILAEDHIRAGGAVPAVFLTDHQTEGQGRDGRVWTDTAGRSILTSIGSGIQESNISIFADLVALSVCRALRENGIRQAKIKYPNDLVIDDKKAGGILVKNVYNGTNYLGTNTGIGINIHYSEEEVRDYGRDYPATALAVYNPRIQRQELLVAVVGSIRNLSDEAEIFAKNAHCRQAYNDLWREYSSVLGKKVQLESAEDVLVQGYVASTEIGRGIFIESASGSRWFNRFDTSMKVRLLN